MRCPTRQKCDNNVMADFLAQIESFTEKFLYFYSSSAKYVPKNISMAGYTSWNLCFFVTLILRTE